MNQPDLATMAKSLRHLMSSNESEPNFVSPTLLREVPSFTSPDTVYRREDVEYAELEGRTSRNWR
jgi:hypothetical protein